MSRCLHGPFQTQVASDARIVLVVNSTPSVVEFLLCRRGGGGFIKVPSITQDGTQSGDPATSSGSNLFTLAGDYLAWQTTTGSYGAITTTVDTLDSRTRDVQQTRLAYYSQAPQQTMAVRSPWMTAATWRGCRRLWTRTRAPARRSRPEVRRRRDARQRAKRSARRAPLHRSGSAELDQRRTRTLLQLRVNTRARCPETQLNELGNQGF